MLRQRAARRRRSRRARSARHEPPPPHADDGARPGRRATSARASASPTCWRRSTSTSCATTPRISAGPERDRFLLSTGHYSIALWAALAEAGILPVEELATYGADDSRLEMSTLDTTPGVEMIGGSLGHGLGQGGRPGARPAAATVRRRGSSSSSPTARCRRARPGRRRCRPAISGSTVWWR